MGIFAGIWWKIGGNSFTDFLLQEYGANLLEISVRIRCRGNDWRKTLEIPSQIWTLEKFAGKRWSFQGNFSPNGWLVRHAPIMAAAGDRLHPVHCAQAQVAHCSVLVTLGQWRTSDGDPVVACPAGSELISPPYWEYELNRREGPTAIRYTHTSLVWAESTQ